MIFLVRHDGLIDGCGAFQYILTKLLIITTCLIEEVSVENYTDHCLVAILTLQVKYLCWPDTSQRKVVKDTVKASLNSIYGDCVGFVDGSLIPPAYTPLRNKRGLPNPKEILHPEHNACM